MTPICNTRIWEAEVDTCKFEARLYNWILSQNTKKERKKEKEKLCAGDITRKLVLYILSMTVNHILFIAWQ